MNAKFIDRSSPEELEGKRRGNVKVTHDLLVRLHRFCDRHCLYPSSVVEVALSSALDDVPFLLDAVDDYRKQGDDQ